MKALICACGVYIGWFLFLIETFDQQIQQSNNLDVLLQNNQQHYNANIQTNDENAEREDVVVEIIGNDIPLRDEKSQDVKKDFDKLQFENEPKLIVGKDEKRKKTEKYVQDNILDETKVHEKGSDQVPNENSKVQDKHDTSAAAKCLASSLSSEKCALLSDFHFDRSNLEQALEKYNQENQQKMKPLRAYIEQEMNDQIPNTGREPDSTNKHDVGEPNQYIEPLPLRTADTASPEKLHKFEYSKVDSCHNLPEKLPTDAGLLFDDEGKMIYPNVANRRKHIDVMEYAKYCPVDADPYLPWIHDVFPSNDGTKVHFVAQNKRRCNTGPGFKDQKQSLLPQAAIMQPVSAKRIDNEKATKIAPELWMPESDHDGQIDDELGLPRYQLVPNEDAIEGDGDFTRFICRFHTLQYDNIAKTVKEVILGETFSTYPTNYEFVNFRKRKTSMMTSKGLDNGLFWLSNLRFDCPVPANGNLQESIALGQTVLDDGTPGIYVDVVPIRTSPRFGYENAMFTTKQVGSKFAEKKVSISSSSAAYNRTTYGFDAAKIYGDKNVLPRVEASGRWENIPVCLHPPHPPVEKNESEISQVSNNESKVVAPTKKIHTLSACLWASATFHTRGNDRMVTDTMDRMKEWLEYHFLVGFDHIYVFDNTGAHTDEVTLEKVLDQYPATKVTRINWPSLCCNNNKPGDVNTGERSSQYAAESACRQRYGQYTEWIANIDTDEYLVPMGKYNSMREVVDAATEEGTKILSFRSTRAYANYDFMEQYQNGGECGFEDNPLCLKKRDDVPYIEAYNCDFTPLPKPTWSDRAKKQIYRPDYVLSHFVHYSTITKDILETHAEAEAVGKRWNHFFYEREKNERFTNELEEAVMVHTKTTVPGNTKGYKETCKFGFIETWKFKCRVGFPIPDNKLDVNASRSDGYKHNCYTNEKLTNVFIPKLKEALRKN
jgi:hypothetical protein